VTQTLLTYWRYFNGIKPDMEMCGLIFCRFIGPDLQAQHNQ